MGGRPEGSEARLGGDSEEAAESGAHASQPRGEFAKEGGIRRLRRWAQVRRTGGPAGRLLLRRALLCPAVRRATVSLLRGVWGLRRLGLLRRLPGGTQGGRYGWRAGFRDLKMMVAGTMRCRSGE